MKVLLRRWEGKEYVWEDAEFRGTHFFVDGEAVSESEIVSVYEDNRSEYVKCSACGQTFKKSDEEIEKHKTRYKDINTCFGCNNLYRDFRRRSSSTERFEHIEDNRYRIITEQEACLRCDKAYTWNSYSPIGSDNAQTNCKYKACETATYDAIEDIFTRHPGIFDDIITVDKIVEVGYKEKSGSYNGSYYRLNGRNTIWAYVNSMSIVDFFSVEYNGYSWSIVYSKKLDKLFWMSGGKYKEWNPEVVNENTKEYIKGKIKELYN